MKEAHLILLFDGTGLSEHDQTLSNSRKIYHCLDDAPVPEGRIQEAKYYSGLGTSESNFFHRTWSQINGHGAPEVLVESYLDLCEFARQNQDAPLKVSIEGFSRGFAIGLVLEKMVHKLGILDFEKIAREKGVSELSAKDKMEFIAEAYDQVYVSKKKPSDTEIQSFRERYSFPEQPDFHLFAFDPVGTFADHPKLKPFRAIKDEMGDLLVTHGAKLPRTTKSYTEFIALHEKRSAYEVMTVDFHGHYDIDRTRVYFEGDHTCIGGGSGLREPLSDIAGLEMLQQMQEKAGVIINEETREHLFTPDMSLHLDNDYGKIPMLGEDFFYAVTRAFVPFKRRELNPQEHELHESVHIRRALAELEEKPPVEITTPSIEIVTSGQEEEADAPLWHTGHPAALEYQV